MNKVSLLPKSLNPQCILIGGGEKILTICEVKQRMTRIMLVWLRALRTAPSPTVTIASSTLLLLLMLPPYRSPAAELFQDRLNKPLDSRGFGSPVGPASSSGQGSSSRPSFSTFTVWGGSLARASFSLAESSMYSPFSSSWPKSYALASEARVGSSGVWPRMQSIPLRLSRSSSLRVRSLRSYIHESLQSHTNRLSMFPSNL
uniref:Uncharacterized protein n=1 Tax=Anopheles maculatus TaxID=74869 RepID=A0A182SDV2_9DIPT